MYMWMPLPTTRTKQSNLLRQRERTNRPSVSSTQDITTCRYTQCFWMEEPQLQRRFPSCTGAGIRQLWPDSFFNGTDDELLQ